MGMDVSQNPFGPGGLEQQQQLQDIQQQAMHEVQQGQGEEKISDSQSVSGEEAMKTVMIEPNNPRLLPPNYAMLEAGSTETQIIRLLETKGLLQQQISMHPEFKALLTAGVKPAEVESFVRNFLESHTNSPHNPQFMTKRAIAEMMGKELETNADPVLKEAWYEARADLLSESDASAGVLIRALKERYIGEGKSPEEAEKLAKQEAVDLVDRELFGNLDKASYGMHPKLAAAVQAALMKAMEGADHVHFKSAMIQDVSLAGKAMSNVIQGGKKVEDPEAARQKNLDAMGNWSDGNKELLNEILALLSDTPMDPDMKVAILAFMKEVAVALANFDQTMKMLQAVDSKSAKDAALVQIEAAHAKSEATIKKIKDAMAKLRAAQAKARKMKGMFSFMSVVTDIIMGAMLAIFGTALLTSGVVLSIALTVMVVYDVIATVLGIGLPIIWLIIAIVFIVLFAVIGIVVAIIVIICAASVVGIFASVVVAIAGILIELVIALVALVIEIFLAVIAIALELLILAIGLIIGVVVLIIGAIFLIALFVFTLVLVSKILMEETSMMEDLANSFGPALINLLDQMGISVDLDTAYLIMVILPIVLAVVILLAPALLTILALVLVPLIATVGSVIMVPVMVLLLAIIAIAYALMLVVNAALTMFGQLGAIVVNVILMIVLAIIMVLLVLLIAILPVVIMVVLALLIMIISVMLSAFLPIMFMIMAQWLPLFLKKSGMIGKAAGGIGGAIGLSQEDIDNLEIALTGLVMGFTAMTGQQSSEDMMGPSASEQDEFDEMGTEQGMQSDIGRLQRDMAQMARIMGLFPDGNLSSAARDKAFLEQKASTQEESINDFMRVLTDLKKHLQKVIGAMTGGNTREQPSPEEAQGLLSEFVTGTMASIMPSILQTMPDLRELMPDRAEELTPEQAPLPTEKDAELFGTTYGAAMAGMAHMLLPSNEALQKYADRDMERYLPPENEEEEIEAPAQVFFG